MARFIGTIAVVLALSSSIASAQGITVADLGMFAGAWTLSLDSPQGAFEQELIFKDEGGKAIAEMSNQMQPETQKVTDITKNGTDKCKVTFDVNGGQFTMSGTGTKK